MASKTYGLKFKFFLFSLLSVSILTSIFQLKLQQFTIHLQANKSLDEPTISRNSINNPIHLQKNRSLLFEYLSKDFKYKEIIKIGLVNINEEAEKEEWSALGKATPIVFDRVGEDTKWEEFFPEWINEERWPLPKCPEVPMPRWEEYDVFDVVVSRIPCGDGALVEKEGVRDVFRLQVNLVVANVVVRSRQHGDDGPVFLVFVGPCEPMWEIFRCDDLLMREEQVRIYRPDLRRLKQKVLMPVGTCRLALPYVKQGDGKINYEFTKLNNPISHPREAFVSILHSSEDYVCGAIALAQSIIQTNSTKDRLLLVDESITKESRQALRAAGWKIKCIDRIQNPHAKQNTYNEWNYSKLRIWQLTHYDKLIFIDSDLIVLKNIDKFFASPQLSAASNDKVLFNSGVMLIEPSECTFKMLMQKRFTLVSYNGGDQGFLNEAFTWWHRWPKKSNYLKVFQVNDTQRELPASLYAIHYIGLKPWMCYRDYDCNWDLLDRQAYASDSAHRRWWQVYDTMPKRLQRFCALSEKMDSKLKGRRGLAMKAKFPDGHWKTRVKDTRQHHLVML